MHTEGPPRPHRLLQSLPCTCPAHLLPGSPAASIHITDAHPQRRTQARGLSGDNVGFGRRAPVFPTTLVCRRAGARWGGNNCRLSRCGGGEQAGTPAAAVGCEEQGRCLGRALRYRFEHQVGRPDGDGADGEGAGWRGARARVREEGASAAAAATPTLLLLLRRLEPNSPLPSGTSKTSSFSLPTTTPWRRSRSTETTRASSSALQRGGRGRCLRAMLPQRMMATRAPPTAFSPTSPPMPMPARAAPTAPRR